MAYNQKTFYHNGKRFHVKRLRDKGWFVQFDIPFVCDFQNGAITKQIGRAFSTIKDARIAAERLLL